MLLKRTAPFSLLLDEPDLPLVDGRGVGEGGDAPLLADESSRQRLEALSSSVSSLLIALTGIGSATATAMGRGAASTGSCLTGTTRFRLAGSLSTLFEGMVG